jgi:hypothetical protein
MGYWTGHNGRERPYKPDEATAGNGSALGVRFFMEKRLNRSKVMDYINHHPKIAHDGTLNQSDTHLFVSPRHVCRCRSRDTLAFPFFPAGCHAYIYTCPSTPQ